MSQLSRTIRLAILTLTAVIGILLLPRVDVVQAAFTMTVSGTNFTSTGFDGQVSIDSCVVSPSTLAMYRCVGSSLYCDTSNYIFSPSIWQPMSSPSCVTNSTVTGLLPGRTYRFNAAAATLLPSAQAFASGTVSTYPEYSFTPTPPTFTCKVIAPATTPTCSGALMWTGSRMWGDSVVHYSTTPPSWVATAAVPAVSTRINYVQGSSDGFVIAVGQNGNIISRSILGTWNVNSTVTSNALYTSSVIDNNNAWVGGVQSTLFRTQDSGANWSPITVSGLPANSIIWKIVPISKTSVIISTSNTSSESPKIYLYNGSTWTLLFQSSTEICNAVTAIDVHNVWIACTSGSIYHSVDITLPSPTWTLQMSSGSGHFFYTIETLDGINIWAGGTSSLVMPILFLSTDSGATWNSVSSIPSGTGTISRIKLLTPSSPFIANASTAWLYNGVTGGWQTFSGTDTALGGNASISTAVRPDWYIAGGSNGKIAEYNLFSGTLVSRVSMPHGVALSGLMPNSTYYYSAQMTGANMFANPTPADTSVTAGVFGTFTTPYADTIKPTVTITPPAPMVRTCPLTVTGSAADTAPGTVQSVSVTLDSNPVVTASGTTSWSVSLPCAQLADGPHTITAIANDGTNDSLPATATFTVDRTAPTVSITDPGIVHTATISLAGSATDNDQVLTVDVLPDPTLGLGRRAASVVVGSTAPWSINNLPMKQGVNHLTVYATDRAGNEGVGGIDVTYDVPTFDITVDKTSDSVQAGSSAVYTVTATSVNGFTGTINFTAAGGPPSNGVSLLPESQTITTPGQTVTTVVTVTTTGGDVGGPYTTSFTAQSGTIIRPPTPLLLLTSVSVKADFSLSTNPSSQEVIAGTSAMYDIIISGTSTYSVNPTNLTFTIPSLPSDLTATFGNSISGDPSHGHAATKTLTLGTTSTQANRSIIVNVSDGTTSHPVSVGITVKAPPDFTVGSAPAKTVTAGPTTSPLSNGFYNIPVTAVSEFNGPVSIAAVDMGDPGITAILPSTVTPSSTGTVMTINVHADSATKTSNPTPGPKTFTLHFVASTTVFGVTAKDIYVSLTVNPDITPPTISTIAAAADYNSVTVTWVTDEPADSQVVVYSDVGLHFEVSRLHRLATCTAACHSVTVPVPVTASPTTYYYSVTSIDTAYKPVDPQGNSTTVAQQNAAPLSFTTTEAPDLTAPLITLDAPLPSVTIIGTSHITAHATDDNPLSQITMSIAPVGFPSLLDQSFPCSATECSMDFQWNTMQKTPFKYPNGSYLISVEAFSTKGSATTNHSIVASAAVIVLNETEPPKVLCYDTTQQNCEPVSDNLLCDDVTNLCTIDIYWKTNQRSTSEVAFQKDDNGNFTCSQNETRLMPDGSTVTMDCTYNQTQKYDFESPLNPNADYFTHHVRLYNLEKGTLYHYRVTSCNMSNLCTN